MICPIPDGGSVGTLSDAVLLASQAGDGSFAARVAVPNNDAADSGLRYGIDGVCHQMAKRILFSTAVDGQTPITVWGAKGYNLSILLYGEYGGRGTRGSEVRESWKELIDNWQSERADS